MVIQGITGVRPGVIPNVIRARGTTGRLFVPVHPLNTIYARFKHIRAVPAAEGGVSVFRLRILDNLIDRLLKFQQRVPGISQLRNIDSDKIQPLINTLQQTLKNQVMRSVSPFGGLYPETGMLINLVA